MATKAAMKLEEIEPPDSHHLMAAVGWLELGNAAEARVELDAMARGLQLHPHVLELRWQVLAELRDWAEALAVAKILVGLRPEESSAWLHRAYATRRAPGGSVEAAWRALLPAADTFPTEALIPYNLACYACQMERLEEARRWLLRAFAVGNRERLRRMSLRDEDLRLLWPEIPALE